MKSDPRGPLPPYFNIDPDAALAELKRARKAVRVAREGKASARARGH